MQLRDLTIKEPFGSVTFTLPAKSCVFCSHCKDFFYDYTNGPYLICCDKDRKPMDWETCSDFDNVD